MSPGRVSPFRCAALGAAIVGLGACSPPPSAPPPDGGASGPAPPQLAAGVSHLCAISSEGALRCWGSNGFGQLGRSGAGDPLAAYSVDLGAGRRARGVFAGARHTCVVLEGGDVKCWGDNGHGQLGLGDGVTRGDGLSAMGDGLPTVDLGAGQRAVAVAAGDAATCALLDTGRVKCWGDAYQGALGYGDNLTRGLMPGTMGDALPTVDLGSRDGVPFRVTAISPVDYHSFCAILEGAGSDASALKCWGSNDYCELGLGAHDGGRGGTPDSVGNNLPWVDLGTTSVGATRHAVALAGGYQFICVLGDDGAVLCWGDNLSGQLGLGLSGSPRSCTPAELGPAAVVTLPAPARAIAARGASDGGGAHACALLTTGEERCWGENAAGQLGTGDTLPLASPSPPLMFPDGFVPAKLVVGSGVSCAVSEDGETKCWGSSKDGQLDGPFGPAVKSDRLAPGPDLRRSGRPIQSLAAGHDHTCALATGGALYCWGRNLEGQLGIGDLVNRGDGPNQMGDSLPAVDLGGVAAISVAAGAAHTCAVLENGAVKCWGDNSSGQLGPGDPAALAQAAPSPVALPARASAVGAGVGFSCALAGGGEVFCWGDNAHGQLGTGAGPGPAAPVTAAHLPAGATQIAAGDAHACALLGDHRVACWGANAHGQLGLGDTTDRGAPAVVELHGRSAVELSARAEETCVRLDGGDIECWGENARGQLGLEDAQDRLAPLGTVNLGSGRTASAVVVGGAFACAVLDIGQVKCWGDNMNAELGGALTGPTYGGSPGQMGDALPVVLQGGGRSVRVMAAGRAHACVILDTHDVRCWGDNAYGQLGAGDAVQHTWYSQPTAIVDLGGS